MKIEISCGTGSGLPVPAASPEECNLSLFVESSKCGEAVILHCQGRIVYREEALALSRAVSEFLEKAQNIVLDFRGVTAIDSAGLGELVSLHMWAMANGCSLRLTGVSSRLFHLFEITNLTSIFEIFPTPEAALRSAQHVA